MILIAFLAGWLLDLAFGDPMWLPHPVVYMGKWISYWEHRLNKGDDRKRKGAMLAVGSVVLTFVIVCLLLWMADGIDELLQDVTGLSDTGAFLLIPSNSFILSTLLIFFCLAGHTLRKEVKMVFEAADRSLEEGRRQVSRIVGRDTQELSEQEVRTAALETLAENLSDGVIAPLFWLAVLGLPGMLTYKMINTLDSMIGYHSPRYKDFGCWAARIDDVANFVPARITAFLMVLASTVKPELIKKRMCFVATFGPQHASPNSGWPEAALASILDCRFGGPHNYFGEVFDKPFIGTNPRNLTTKDMQTSLRTCFVAELLAIINVVIILYWVCCIIY